MSLSVYDKDTHAYWIRSECDSSSMTKGENDLCIAEPNSAASTIKYEEVNYRPACLRPVGKHRHTPYKTDKNLANAEAHDAQTSFRF